MIKMFYLHCTGRMEIQSQLEVFEEKLMLPPPPGTFQDREELIKHVCDFGACQGYVVTIKKSRRDRRVILGCDRGGVYRNRRKMDENKRKRKACSRLINCPFEAIGKKDDDVWVLTIRNGEHNHEPLRDMSEHPYSRRFTEDEVRQIKQMTEDAVFYNWRLSCDPPRRCSVLSFACRCNSTHSQIVLIVCSPGTRLVVSVRGDESKEELEILKSVDATMILHNVPNTEEKVGRVHAARR